MHRFQNLSYKEAAELLNVSPKTVDYRIQQALKLLREDLKDYLPLTVLLALHIGWFRLIIFPTLPRLKTASTRLVESRFHTYHEVNLLLHKALAWKEISKIQKIRGTSEINRSKRLRKKTKVFFSKTLFSEFSRRFNALIEFWTKVDKNVLSHFTNTGNSLFIRVSVWKQ